MDFLYCTNNISQTIFFPYKKPFPCWDIDIVSTRFCHGYVYTANNFRNEEMLLKIYLFLFDFESWQFSMFLNMMRLQTELNQYIILHYYKHYIHYHNLLLHLKKYAKFQSLFSIFDYS